MTCHDIEARLDDYVDGALSSETRAAIESHLEGCARCRRSLDGLRSLLRDAATLPREEQPPRDLWPAVRTALESEGAGAAARAAAPPWARRIALAAAAVVLVTIGVGITLLVQGWSVGPAPRVADTAASTESGTTATPAALASFRAAEHEYQRATDELMTLYERRRASLAPETVAEVERNLTIINQAIGDARTALENDPSNRRLGQVAASMYERKVDLLRYLTRLSVPGLQG